MSKECKDFDLEERLIDFAVRIIRTAESCQNPGLGTILRDNSSAAAHPLHRIMGKPRVLNPARILSIK